MDGTDVYEVFEGSVVADSDFLCSPLHRILRLVSDRQGLGSVRVSGDEASGWPLPEP